jgi:hypothetical protein
MNMFTVCQNIKKTYHDNCNEFVIAELAEIELKFIALFMGLSGIIYLKNNRELLSEILFQVGYKSFLAVTKISNAYRRIKNYFVSSESVTTGKKKAYIYDEVKVIKNGVRHASFETMETFKESSYLGNPNDYYDLEEVVEESASSSSSSSSFDSDLVSSSSPSPSPPSSPSSSSPSSTCQLASVEHLFVMENNESNNTVEFKTFDFIMHTNYMYPESTEISKQNYTKIYRTFTENDFYADKTAYETSNAEMIICNLEIDGDDTETEYEIDLSQPYNFNVVGNLVLDEKFVHWYILKKYNYAIERSINYKITCITKDIKTFQLDRSSGLRVHFNEYEEVHQLM